MLIFGFLTIGDLNLGMMLCIVDTDFKRIIFHMVGNNVCQVETVQFGAWRIRIAAILQEICSFFDS